MNSLASKLLVAVPQLSDENFRHAVVLMLEHTAQGGLGLVLNQPSEMPLDDLWRRLANRPSKAKGVLHRGGPVEGAVVALHTRPEWGNSQVVDGLFLTHQKSELEQVFDLGTTPLRVYSGCAGWGPGQLERELAEGSWFVCDLDLESFFDEPELMWRDVVERIGRRIVLNEADYRRIPPSPELN
ncbi:MAG TPA: YqgE/AlgH family protein [Pirellulaceae bacterium]|nr:YqgE/AlgH family protein [Pirellulaceae bacterium]